MSQFKYRADPSGLVAEGTASRQSPEILGVNLIEAREEVETIIGRGSGFIGVDSFHPRSKRIFELCLEEASLGHDYIGTEHLLALIRDGQGGCKSIRKPGS